MATTYDMEFNASNYKTGGTLDMACLACMNYHVYRERGHDCNCHCHLTERGDS